jgi:hypothetical protein
VAEWIKWWKDKTFLTVLGIVLITMAISFCVAFFSCAWWLSVAIACLGGIGIRRVIVKKLDDMSNNNLKKE